ncbi:hypothetical protein [Vibrio sp. 10N.239.312.D08]|uniref:hypothetical protein n=1 Tax=Vibrio sp. 10N.239.312.D08 TaxID=3229978 RepID=UPI0035524CB3
MTKLNDDPKKRSDNPSGEQPVENFVEPKSRTIQGYRLHSRFRALYLWMIALFMVSCSLSLLELIPPRLQLGFTFIFVVVTALQAGCSMSLWVPDPENPPAEEKLKEIASMKEDMKTLWLNGKDEEAQELFIRETRRILGKTQELSSDFSKRSTEEIIEELYDHKPKP